MCLDPALVGTSCRKPSQAKGRAGKGHMQLMTTHPDRRVRAVVDAALSRHRVQATFLSCSSGKDHFHAPDLNELRSARTTARRR